MPSPSARLVLPEILDQLPEDDPRARHSRRDLQRINRLMGACPLLLRAMRQLVQPPRSIVEIGAGDGTLMLRLAQRLQRHWPTMELSLLDRQALVTQQTLAKLQALGWPAHTLTMEVEEWLAQKQSGEIAEGEREEEARTAAKEGAGRGQPRHGLILANLFIHHFDEAQLRSVLAGIAACSDAFIACEPRRHPLALAGSHLVGLLGANAVTREDAVLSVRAGFSGRELSALWPATGDWILAEYPAGLFSHCFVAQRRRAGLLPTSLA